MDELKEMIRQTYKELQSLAIVPTKNNVTILGNAFVTLENCYTVACNVKVNNPEEDKEEEPEDVNEINEPRS